MLMINSLNAYTKNLKMQMEMDMKQASGQLGSHKSMEDYLKAVGLPGEDDEHKPDTKLRDIHQKLFCGSKLTTEERKYLQSKDPKAYTKLQMNEMEQKAFEARLRQCRTKEEASRLRLAYIGSSMATVKAVEHNSNISNEKKMEILMQEKHRNDLFEKSTREFVRRGDYDALPTDAEAAKARRDAQKAKMPRKKENKRDRLDKDGKRAEKSGRYERRRPAVHVETVEEKKVKRARARARASAAADYGKAMQAYMAVCREAKKSDTEVKVESMINMKG